MEFEQYLSRLIEFTEDRKLVMQRQAEAFSSFCHGASVEFTGKFLTALGLPQEPRSSDYPNF
jgi:hypothetical protein